MSDLLSHFDTQIQNQNSRDAGASRGAWVYWRED